MSVELMQQVLRRCVRSCTLKAKRGDIPNPKLFTAIKNEKEFISQFHKAMCFLEEPDVVSDRGYYFESKYKFKSGYGPATNTSNYYTH